MIECIFKNKVLKFWIYKEKINLRINSDHFNYKNWSEI